MNRFAQTQLFTVVTGFFILVICHLQYLAQDSYAHWRQAMAQEKAGDKDGAKATRTKLLAANRRDAPYLYVRAQLSASAVSCFRPARVIA